MGIGHWALGSQRRGEAVRSSPKGRRQGRWGFPPGGTAERVSRLEATGVIGHWELEIGNWELGIGY
ncbi:MAG: hypothetical protein HWQ58_18840 [Nostoc sp. LPT]|nr:hypothetical protein [Nostoc sp. LPT]